VANTGFTPIAPTPPPPPRPPRSIAGPVVLIVIGLVFLLLTMGVIDHQRLGVLFAHYWPLLLILWGVIKLVEHEQAKRAGLQSRGIGVGGAFLLFFLIMGGLAATGISRVNWGEMRNHFQIDDEDFDQIFGGSSFDYSDELSHGIPKGANVRINDDHGAVSVSVGDGDTIKVSVRKKIRADKQQDADDYNTKTKPTITVVDKTVTVEANTHGAGDKGVSTDLDVYVPRNTDLTIVSKRGDISLTSITGKAEITHQHGEIDLTDHTGNVELNIDHSSARVQHLKGDFTIQGRANEVSIEDVDGVVHLNGEFQESVRLVHVTRGVMFKSSRTDMEFSRLDGRLDLDSGDLRADSMIGPMRLITRSKDITLEGLSGDLRLQNENGMVSVGLHKPGNIQIDNRKGDVQVSIPPSVAVNVDARTRKGDIESDFSEVKIESKDRESTANGSIGSNGPHLIINGNDGTIEIRKGSVAVATPPSPPSPPAVPGKTTKALRTPKAPPVESEN